MSVSSSVSKRVDSVLLCESSETWENNLVDRNWWGLNYHGKEYKNKIWQDISNCVGYLLSCFKKRISLWGHSRVPKLFPKYLCVKNQSIFLKIGSSSMIHLLLHLKWCHTSFLVISVLLITDESPESNVSCANYTSSCIIAVKVTVQNGFFFFIESWRNVQ